MKQGEEGTGISRDITGANRTRKAGVRKGRKGRTDAWDLKDAAGVGMPVVDVVTAAHRHRDRVLAHRLRYGRLVLGRHVAEAVQCARFWGVALLLAAAQT